MGLAFLSAASSCARPSFFSASGTARHQDGRAVLALLGPGDELVAPAHDLADVRKADQLELADDLLDRHLGALSPGAHDLRDAVSSITLV
jgi:hypothetical protein